jgi:hypothetical protein
MTRQDLFLGDTDRYAFDFGQCSTGKGYAQLDTAQDASYFGNWINPFKKQTVTFAEGDCTVITCDDEAEFVAKVRETCEWYAQNDGKRPGIDPGFNVELKAEFERLGLAEWVH